ncbi:MAG: class I adenylate-forming enzyme family protein [Hyphomicrobiaceae bacterium]
MRAPFSRTAFDLLAEQAAVAPHHDAVMSAAGQLSYGNLRDRARHVAGYLREAGVKRGDRIGLLANNRAEWLEIFFGIAALGAVVVPFSTWSTTHELAFLLDDSEVSWMFTIAAFGDRRFGEDIVQLAATGRSQHLKHVVLIDDDSASPPGHGAIAYRDVAGSLPIDDVLPGEGASANDILTILYTSGSSSRPKAVPLDHYAAIENGFNIGRRQGLRGSDRVLLSIPLFWSYGAVNALPAILSHGATMVLQSHFEPTGALDLIEAHQCTAIYTLPAMTNALVANEAFRPERTESLRTGVTIGAPQDIIKAANELGASEMCNIYGGTENYGNCCVTPHHWPLEQRAVCQGPPLPGVHVRIRDPESGGLLAPGQVGSIEVKGYLTRGYAGQSSRFNAETFTDDGYFRTGDLGAMGEDGAMRFAGRSSEMIKRSGINVSPSEVEEVLQNHPGVGLAAVTGVDDADRGEIIVAYVTVENDGSADPDDILAFCKEHLSRYKIPDHLVVTETLPLTVTGKVMRRELKTLATNAFSAGSGAGQSGE